jgi:hypothetical protein
LSLIDDGCRAFERELELPMPGEQIATVRMVVPSPAGHRKVALLDAGQRVERQVVSRRRLPLIRRRAQCMVAGMVIGRVEGHAPKQLYIQPNGRKRPKAA